MTCSRSHPSCPLVHNSFPLQHRTSHLLLNTPMVPLLGSYRFPLWGLVCSILNLSETPVYVQIFLLGLALQQRCLFSLIRPWTYIQTFCPVKTSRSPLHWTLTLKIPAWVLHDYRRSSDTWRYSTNLYCICISPSMDFGAKSDLRLNLGLLLPRCTCREGHCTSLNI